VNGGVTVVSRDTFVNARPVARNVVSVPARELAVAPVSGGIAIEPVRSSVLGAGRAVVNKPPASVMSRPVVALRTPSPMQRLFDQRQAQAGEHLNQQSSAQPPPIGQSLVRQEAPGRPVPVTRQPQKQDGFHSFEQTNVGGSQTKPQPRVWEEQGTAEPEKTTQAQSMNRGAQGSGVQGSGAQGFGARTPQQPGQQWSHPLAKPVAPVQRNEQQQREQEQKTSTSQQPRPASPQRQQSAPAPRSVAPPAKGH
jgi:hypothetical protein